MVAGDRRGTEVAIGRGLFIGEPVHASKEERSTQPLRGPIYQERNLVSTLQASIFTSPLTWEGRSATAAPRIKALLPAPSRLMASAAPSVKLISTPATREGSP